MENGAQFNAAKKVLKLYGQQNEEGQQEKPGEGGSPSERGSETYRSHCGASEMFYHPQLSQTGIHIPQSLFCRVHTIQ